MTHELVMLHVGDAGLDPVDADKALLRNLRVQLLQSGIGSEVIANAAC